MGQAYRTMPVTVFRGIILNLSRLRSSNGLTDAVLFSISCGWTPGIELFSF